MEYRQAGNEMLETEVLTASPAKLRLMMIDFALANLSDAIRQAKASGRVQKNEATLNVREALDELLCGIRPSEENLPHQVADLYVFLLQWLTAAEADGDVHKLTEIAIVLEVERDTWSELNRGLITPPVGPPMGLGTVESICFDA